MNEKQKRNIFVGVAIIAALVFLYWFFSRGSVAGLPTVLAGSSTGNGLNFPEFSFAGPDWGNSELVIPELFQPGGFDYTPGTVTFGDTNLGTVPQSCMTMCCGTDSGYSSNGNNFDMFFGF